MAVQQGSGGSTLELMTARLSRNADVVLATAVMMIIAMMVIPLPPWLLDLLVADRKSVV